MKTETIILNEARNVTLTAYLQEVGGEFHYVTKRPAILVLPGGGYQYCSDREADPIAMPYLKAGYQAFILRYSVKQDAVWPTPLEDYEQAMALIRENAEKWALFADKVAVIGFSAGGHLAAAAATMAKNRPNAAILGYAVAGADVKGCSPTAPDTIPYVDENTPPCFLFAARDDNVVPVLNSIKFMEALCDAGVTFESHIYSYGGHGFSTGDPSIHPADISARVPHWVEDSIGWLTEVFGEYGDGVLKEPRVKARINADKEAFLSVDCTFAHIMSNPEGREFLNAMMQKMRENIPAEQQSMGDSMQELVGNMKLRDMLAYAHTPQEVLDGINAKLQTIPNI